MTRQLKKKFNKEAKKHISTWLEGGIKEGDSVEHAIFGKVRLLEFDGINCLVNLDHPKISYLKDMKTVMLENDIDGNNLLKCPMIHLYGIGKVPEKYKRAARKLKVTFHAPKPVAL